MFIAEEGPECFTSKSDELQDCFNVTMGHYFGGEMPSVDNLPTLIIKEEHCYDMDKLEACVSKHLHKCKESTPVNLVESLFKFVRKETPCKNYPKKDSRSGGATFTKISINVLVGTWLMALFAKFIVSSQ